MLLIKEQLLTSGENELLHAVLADQTLVFKFHLSPPYCIGHSSLLLRMKHPIETQSLAVVCYFRC
jgi:hypothetical protein